MSLEAGSDKSMKVIGVARRLRVLHAELSDLAPDARRAHLNDEIDRAVKSLVPAERRGFLEALLDTFPTTGADASDAAAATARAAASTGEAEQLRKDLIAAQQKLARLDDPSVLVERLIEIAAGLPEDKRKAIAKRLAAAGLAEVRHVGEPAAPVAAPVPAAAPVAPPKSVSAMASTPNLTTSAGSPAPASGGGAPVSTELRKVLGLGEAEAADPGRAQEMAVMLVDFAGGIDQFVWTAWSQKLAAGSKKITRKSPVQRTLARFVMGDSGTPRTAVAQELALLRQLTVGTIAAVSRAGSLFARNQMMQFGVESIAAASGPKSLTESKESKNWKKYVELMQGRDEAVIEAEIMTAVRDYVESLFPRT
ncbi:MAG: hypothetical protein SFY96_03850 [Planctomycetota bacterium]|nr:hypothetical protein [Planctomycetota bacterium]